MEEAKTIDEIKDTERKAIISGPFGSNISSKYFVEDGVPVIRGNNLSLGINTKFKDEGFVYITEEKAQELNTWAKKDDLIFTAVGTIGQVGLLTGKEKYQKYIISNKQLRVTLNQRIIDPLFAYYWFASERMVDQIMQRNTGSSVPLINLSVLKSLLIPVPPPHEQKAITSVLSSFDDKIDLLDRQNQNLEALAKTLFQQWFVEEAKQCWEERPLASWGEIICGKTPSKSEPRFFGGDIPFIKIPDMHGQTFVFRTEDSLTNEGRESQQKKTLPNGAICVSSIATVGLVAMTTTDSQTNQQINSIIPNKDIYRYFLYLHMGFSYDLLHAMASGGTTTLNLNTGNFSKIAISFPGDDALKEFHALVAPIFEKIKENQRQKITIKSLRDSLLPKLMSGEITVDH